MEIAEQVQQEIEISRKIFGIPVFKHNSSFRSIDGSGTWDEWLAPARPLDASHKIDAQVIDNLLRDINHVSVDFHHRALICPSYYKKEQAQSPAPHQCYFKLMGQNQFHRKY